MDTQADRSDGLRAARLAPGDYESRFADAAPPLSAAQAQVEAERCLYCFDAPCTAACPTGIDVPAFIQRVAQGNLRGAARAILEANPLGGMCARVCPTEVLCEQACVRSADAGRAVEIGALQRHATDAYFAQPGAPLFTRAAPSGRRVAVVGAGPAGLTCAHGLARLGHAVTLFDARPKAGGLNEYGLAAYKTAGGFAQQEVAWLLSIGGIEMKLGQCLGSDFTLEELLAGFDAVFLGMGLAGVNALEIPTPQLPGLRDAVDFIADLRQHGPAQVPVGRRVLVLGGGMTAIDAAVQARLLGAQEVSIVYRRGPQAMPASRVEQQRAQTQGVTLRHWLAPREVLTLGGALSGMRFAATEMHEGRLRETGETVVLGADMVLKAIGQVFLHAPVGTIITLRAGRIAAGDDGRTSHPRVWAGGDCRAGGRDLTVDAVQQGKLAARSIAATLAASPVGQEAAHG